MLKYILSTLLLLSASCCFSVKQVSNYPLFTGAEVFIEPGQSAADMDVWFKRMHECQFSVCRIRMFEAYMHKSDGTWDFGLYDQAFEAAARYGIKIFANPFPLTSKTDIGGLKFPRDNAHLEQISVFLKMLTLHFKNYKNLAGYVLINEPGSGKAPTNEFAKQQYESWKKNYSFTEYDNKGYPILADLTDKAFLKDLNTWYLQWIATQITNYDNTKEIHVNNHAIFNLAAEYDFPAWRNFLTTLGGSAHAGWHFDYFQRSQYPMAVAANAEIIRSGAGNLPWWMTELQGGNNTYSASKAMCPTKEEIAQWMWLVTAAGGKGSMFWCLNPRSSGIEAGEWALLDYQNNATDRMLAAADVSRTIANHETLFANSKPFHSGINILYVRESMWAEEKLSLHQTNDYEARQTGAVMKSALGYFETLCQLGINSTIKEFGEYNFDKVDFKGEVIILANQIAIPSNYIPVLEKFVLNGGKLIVDGLSAYYDQNLVCSHVSGFMWSKLLGGSITEYKAKYTIFTISINKLNIPASLWKGYIKLTTGMTLNTDNEGILAVRNKLGEGEVVWIPSLLGLGARNSEYKALSKFLSIELKNIVSNYPLRFSHFHKNLIMKILESDNQLISIITNSSDKDIKLKLLSDKSYQHKTLYSNGKNQFSNSRLKIQKGSTMVMLFEQKK